LGCGAAVLAAFRARESIAGSTSRGLGAVTYLIVGTIALVVAALVATGRGRELPRPVGLRGRRGAPEGRPGPGRDAKSRTEQMLERGSIVVAAGVGVILGIPGPFDLVALGRLSRGGYSTIVLIAALVAFTLIKFLLIELPLLSYTIHPEATAARVDRFAAWMKAYKVEIIATVVGVVGVVLIGHGISRLG
jgi:hypothetical protein